MSRESSGVELKAWKAISYGTYQASTSTSFSRRSCHGFSLGVSQRLVLGAGRERGEEGEKLHHLKSARVAASAGKCHTKGGRCGVMSPGLERAKRRAEREKNDILASVESRWTCWADLEDDDSGRAATQQQALCATEPTQWCVG